MAAAVATPGEAKFFLSSEVQLDVRLKLYASHPVFAFPLLVFGLHLGKS
jgi:hypothetical protein